MRSGKTDILVDIVTASVRMWEKNPREGATMLLPSASTVLKYHNTYTADALTLFQHARAHFTSNHQDIRILKQSNTARLPMPRFCRSDSQPSVMCSSEGKAPSDLLAYQ